MNNRFMALACCVLIFTACAPSTPSVEAINTALAETQAAEPTATRTIMPTETPKPTATPTETPTPSSTPDIRVIDIDPRKLLLQKTHLPVAGQYFLPNEGWISPMTNAEIMASWTVEEGKAYLAETGRIDGWWVSYKRGTTKAVLPDEVYDNVVLYQTPEGARLIVTKYGERYIDDSFTEITVTQVGDASRAFKKSETNSSGQTIVSIVLIFSYRNVYHTIQTWGWEGEVDTKFSLDVANRLILGLEQLPLADTVTFVP